MSLTPNEQTGVPPQTSQQEAVGQVVSTKLKRWFGWSISSDLDYSQLARDGIDPKVVAELQTHGFKRDDLQWVIPSRTLTHRMRKREKLNREESAKVIRVARLTAQAETIFGNSDKAHRWLSKAKKRLNGLTPKQAMQDEFGAALVTEMLRQIDSGYF